MHIEPLDTFFKDLLAIAQFSGIDSSQNGLQIANDGKEIMKIAFAVDAALETFERSAACKADLLFVHHGLFWDTPLALTGNHRKRLAYLLEHNMALYAVHLPLDAHPLYGNNAVLADLLGIENKQPFGEYHGVKIGCKGTLKEPLAVEEAAKRIAFMERPVPGVYPFGKREIKTAAIVSGAAAVKVLQAIDEGVDLYICGEMSHQIYHEVQEAGINMIAGGHYSTEVWGVRAVMEQCAMQLNLDIEFIDVPTGL
ncbi:Nif3-like dinuclear metal center hexameric protein [Breznakiellaceae bacterium SP9]